MENQHPARLFSRRLKAFSGRLKVHHIIILLACLAILAASLLLQTDSTDVYLFGLKSPARCLLYHTFGVKCALCGLTRSFCSMAHGNLLESVQLHLLGPVIFVFICLQIPYRIYALMIYPRKINATIMKIGLGTGVLLTAALFVNWLIYLGGLIL